MHKAGKFGVIRLFTAICQSVTTVAAK